MLSAAAVFRDILPGYRIRLPTDKELSMPVSKDVKKLRDYESALLRSYQVVVGRVLDLPRTCGPTNVHAAVILAKFQ
jgi:nucleolar complex protein 3